MKTLISIQDEYIQTVVAGAARWAHSKRDGHLARIRRGARRKAVASLAKLGFSEAEADRIVDDAKEMAELEINAE